MTAAEEAAIRQITPLISIVRLTHGNIGSKGNTSCVWQQSRLNTVLPNLPQNCGYIVVKRASQNQQGSQLRSTRFSRHRIQRALELLQETGLGVWDIQISNDNLNAWPEEGDLCDINQNLVVLERDENGNIVDDESDEEARLNVSVPVDSDGGDTGPAPLQNDVLPDETFEGVTVGADSSTSNVQESHMMAGVVEQAVNRIRSQQQVNMDGQPQPQFNSTGTTATFQQPDVLPTNGFADMNKTPYAWARAFPTVFIPTYVEVNGQLGWYIFHDITGWIGARDKPIKMTDWYQYMMWRSDGVPASHPTFSLVLYNHKVKCQVQQQGRYVVNTSQMDPTTTVSEIRNAATDDEVRVQTEEILKRAHIHTQWQCPGNTAILERKVS